MPFAINRRHFVSGAASLAAIGARPVWAAPKAGAAPDDGLSDEQLGALNYVAHIATQPSGEWYGMGIPSYQGGDEGYRWQIGWWLQPLATVQHRMPAYRELYKRCFEGFIAKMSHRDTWSYWESQSTGMAMNDSLGVPGRDKPTADPIARDNINYSANTMNLMAMHQMFYRDDTFLQPHAFQLKHWTRDGLEVFSYNLPKVAQALYDGFRETGWKGVACEVNGVYPAYCNQLALVAFKQYDQIMPGGMGAELIANHVKAWQGLSDLYRTQTHGPGKPEPYIPRGYFVKQDAMVAMGDTMMTSAAYVNAWNPQWVEENYPYWKKRFSVQDGVMSVRLEPEVRGHLDHNPYAGPPHHDAASAWSAPGQSELGETPAFYYYAAISGAEMGDKDFLQAVRNHAVHFGNGPQWRGNEFFYDRNDLKGPARMSRGGSVLMTAATLVEPGSFRALYNQPWTAEQRATPQLEQVDWPNVLVRRAAYDRGRQALGFTLLRADALRQPGLAPVVTSFAVTGLDGARDYSIARDGKVIGSLRKGLIASGVGADLKWQEGRLSISTPVAGDAVFTIQAV